MATSGAVLVDGTRQPARLGALIGKGGEGSVYELADDGTRVAKIYHDPSRINVAKLQAMLRIVTPSLTRIATWPERSLHERFNASLVGFIMRRAEGTNLFDLLGPSSRKSDFPDATYPFVVRTAVNLARAFATTHAAGAVVGDVKEVNQLVDRQALVTLVDTDGFQIKDPTTGQVFYTLAVTPTHQPPELQGVSDVSRVVRTPEQDAFGLAVLLFQLLFMGRHPFTGVPIANQDLEIPAAIKALQFSWAPNLTNRLYAQPPRTLSLDSVDRLAPLFIRAFLPATGGRPTAAEWVRELSEYERRLQKCRVNPSHAFVGNTCPLCGLETATGVLLFLGPLSVGASRVFDLDAIWKQIQQVVSPGAAPEIPVPAMPAAASAAVALGTVRRRQRVAAAVVVVSGLVAFYVAFRVTTYYMWWLLAADGVLAWIVWAQGTADVDAFRQEQRRAQADYDAARSHWLNECGDGWYQQKLRSLALARDALRAYEAEKASRLRRLQTNAREYQLNRFLRSQRVANARITGIGAGRVTTLRSYGIETAYDVNAQSVRAVPGFGPVLQSYLTAWRDMVAANFVFDASRAIDPRDVQEIEREFAVKRAAHEQTLRLGAAALAQVVEQTKQNRELLRAQMTQKAASLAQARANAAAAR